MRFNHMTAHRVVQRWVVVAVLAVFAFLLSALSTLLPAGSSARAETPCEKIRMSDVGWTDITATTAVAAELLRDLGYQSRIELLSVPVTFMSVKNGDIDVFLGNWMPTQKADVEPYLKSGDVVDLGVNLEGALFTLAVPKYVYDAGVTSAEHLAAHRDKFGGRLYGIEPGNDGNRTILDLIAKNTYGLKGWNLVESSEQGMLSEVARATASGKWIVFLGWKPHPILPRRSSAADCSSGTSATGCPRWRPSRSCSCRPRSRCSWGCRSASRPRGARASTPGSGSCSI